MKLTITRVNGKTRYRLTIGKLAIQRGPTRFGETHKQCSPIGIRPQFCRMVFWITILAGASLR